MFTGIKNIIFLLLLFYLFLGISPNSFAQINRKYVEESAKKAEVAKKNKNKNKTKADDPLSTKGFLEYGFNFGMYFANNNTANYYNGSNNINNLEKLIGPEMWNANGTPADTTYVNPYHKQIKELYRHEFEIKELPQRMRYNKPTAIGFHLKYNVSDHMAIFGDFNYAKLTTVDQFSIQLITGDQISNRAVIFNKIKGTEQRYDINVGVFMTFGKSSLIKPFVQAAFNLNNTLVKDASVEFRNDSVTKQTLTFSFLNPYYNYYNMRDWGLGYGVLAGGGLRLMLNDKFLTYIGGDVSMKHIYIGDNKGFHPHGLVYIRILYNMRLLKKKEEKK